MELVNQVSPSWPRRERRELAAFYGNQAYRRSQGLKTKSDKTGIVWQVMNTGMAIMNGELDDQQGSLSNPT
jgi:hypothetical protein